MTYSPESLARVAPTGLARLADGPRFDCPPHIRLIDNALVDVARGRIKRLAIFMPPRHGKSELCSRTFPAWYLATNPTQRLMLASYESEFAASWGAKAQALYREFAPIVWGVGASRSAGARGRWETGQGGGMMTAGVGAGMTGRGANVLLIDDPIKNAQEANSLTYRENAWEWYRSTAYTRLEPEGAIVLIQTRWHEDDLAGRILKDEAEDWTVLSLPALAESSDILGRAEGEALWPDRYDTERLKEIRNTVGSYWWAAMFQQRPAPLGGGIIQAQHFRYYTDTEAAYILHTPEGDVVHGKGAGVVLQFVDLAASMKDIADYFVLGTFLYLPNGDRLVLDITRTRVQGPEQPQLIESQVAKWHPAYTGIEAVGYQLSLVQTMAARGMTVRPIYPDRDKVSRAITLGVQYEQGRWYHRRGAPWLADFEGELLAFPHGEHDDQVDVASYAAAEDAPYGTAGTGGPGRVTATPQPRTYGRKHGTR